MLEKPDVRRSAPTLQAAIGPLCGGESARCDRPGRQIVALYNQVVRISSRRVHLNRAVRGNAERDGRMPVCAYRRRC